MLGGNQSFDTKEEFLEYAKKMNNVMKKLKVERLNRYIKIKGYRIVKINGEVSLESDGTSDEQTASVTAQTDVSGSDPLCGSTEAAVEEATEQAVEEATTESTAQSSVVEERKIHKRGRSLVSLHVKTNKP